jgi:predicted RNA-binding Zn ribbon-like protein
MSDDPSWDWLGDDLAVDLANTVRRRRDGEAELIRGPADLEAWLGHEATRVPVPAHVGEGLVRRFLALRDDALAVLRAAAAGAPLPHDAVAAINAVARATPAVRLLGDRPGTAVTSVPHAADDAGALLALLAAAVIDLAARPAAGGVALCDAPSCGQLFLRTRPDQQWCGPGCGNRARAARHHARAARAR